MLQTSLGHLSSTALLWERVKLFIAAAQVWVSQDISSPTFLLQLGSPVPSEMITLFVSPKVGRWTSFLKKKKNHIITFVYFTGSMVWSHALIKKIPDLYLFKNSLAEFSVFTDPSLTSSSIWAKCWIKANSNGSELLFEPRGHDERNYVLLSWLLSYILTHLI